MNITAAAFISNLTKMYKMLSKLLAAHDLQHMEESKAALTAIDQLIEKITTGAG